MPVRLYWGQLDVKKSLIIQLSFVVVLFQEIAYHQCNAPKEEDH